MDMHAEQFFMSEEYLKCLRLVAIAIESGVKKEMIKSTSIVPSYYGSFTITEVFNDLISSLFETEILDSYGNDYKENVENILKTAELSELGRKMIIQSSKYEELAIYEIKSPIFKDFPVDSFDLMETMTFGRTKNALLLCVAHEFGEPEYDDALREIMRYYDQYQLSGVKI